MYYMKIYVSGWPTQVFGSDLLPQIILDLFRWTHISSLERSFVRHVSCEICIYFLHGFSIDFDVFHVGPAFAFAQINQHFQYLLFLEELEVKKIGTIGSVGAEHIQDTERLVGSDDALLELHLVLYEIVVLLIPNSADSRHVYFKLPVFLIYQIN